MGPQAERLLQDLHSDLFLAVDGLDPDVGFSAPDILEAQWNTIMMRVSHEVTVVADASKFGHRSLSVVGRVESARTIITDQRISENGAPALAAKGVDVIVV